MSIVLKKELHPLYETLGLIYLRRHFDTARRETINTLDQMGISGENFYNDNMSWLENYVEKFSQKYVSCPDEDFFFEDEADFFMLFTAFLAEYPEMENTLQTLSDRELLDMLSPLLTDEFNVTPPVLDTDLERFEFVESLEISSTFKWKLLCFLREPARYASSILRIYKENLPAFEYTVEENRSAIDSLILRCPDSVNESFAKNIKMFAGDAVLYLSLAAPLVEWFILTSGFYGVLIHKAFHYGQEQHHQKEVLMMFLKALSDKSKFEILYSLKNAPKYNLEIAEELGLTPATMSHHMSILLSNNLVSVDKKNGKVYYHIEQKKIKEAVNLLKEFFL